MCRDVKYIILLYSSLRNYHNTNTDATSHSVTTGNHSNQIKQQQCPNWASGRPQAIRNYKETEWTQSLVDSSKSRKQNKTDLK